MAQENDWLIAEAEQDGKPVILRAMSSVPRGIKTEEFSKLVSIFWEYRSPNDAGMPDSDTNEQQLTFESALEALAEGGYSYPMIVVTGNGVKEWHWYTKDSQAWMDRLNEQLKDHPTYPLAIELSDDPEWSLYHSFLSGISGR